jgi:hypothetical protein
LEVGTDGQWKGFHQEFSGEPAARRQRAVEAVLEFGSEDRMRHCCSLTARPFGKPEDGEVVAPG